MSESRDKHKGKMVTNNEIQPFKQQITYRLINKKPFLSKRNKNYFFEAFEFYVFKNETSMQFFLKDH